MIITIFTTTTVITTVDYPRRGVLVLVIIANITTHAHCHASTYFAYTSRCTDYMTVMHGGELSRFLVHSEATNITQCWQASTVGPILWYEQGATKITDTNLVVWLSLRPHDKSIRSPQIRRDAAFFRPSGLLCFTFYNLCPQYSKKLTCALQVHATPS